ncbi:actin-bundling T4SS effector WalE1 family protein [Wolbachia pipientis]|uniref:actin-bundling T4SS effector WalE1 family protein n=1 Tax=Wolbachia pipientis TaxID=955 RepID=UPI00202EA8D2|nr:hypothetical protein [Wolbachia pipientis]MCM1002487.1 hypothetical protein [Wolbachia pipientis]
MPRENNTLNNTVETQLGQKIESLEKEIKSLRKQNRLNSGIIGLGVIGLIGYIIATNWSAIAPAIATAGTATVAAAPVIGIVIGAIIGAAVLAGASYAAYKHRAEIKAGFKYAAEKTVEGAKHTAGKIKAGAVYVKDPVKEGYEHSVDSLKRGAHLVRDRIADTRNALAVAIYDDREKYEDRSEVKEAAAKRKEDRILKSSREMRNNMFYGDAKPKKSFSLPLFSPLKQKFQQPSNSPDPVETGSTPPNSGPQNFATIARRPGVARRHSISDPTKVETPKVPTRSNSLPDLSMVGNAPKESSLEEAFFNDPTVKKHLKSLHTSSAFSSSASDDVSVVPKSPTSGYGSKKSSPISSGGSTPGSRFVTANSSGKSTPTSGLSKPVDHKALAKELEELRKSSSTSRSNSPDSGRGSSGSSTPIGRQSPAHAMLTEKNGSVKTQADLRKAGSLDKLVGQKPSTKMSKQKSTPVSGRLETLV